MEKELIGIMGLVVLTLLITGCSNPASESSGRQ